jgi:hypothetical protein
VGHLETGEPVLPEVDGWQFHALKAALSVGSAASEPGHVAMAMAG